MRFKRYLKTFYESKCDEAGLTLKERVFLNDFVDNNQELIETLSKF